MTNRPLPGRRRGVIDRGVRIGLSNKNSQNRGFAILLVLWFLVPLALLGVHLAAIGRGDVDVARNIESSAKAEALADAGVARAIYTATEPDPSQRWAFDGLPHLITAYQGDISIRLYDEAGRVNPNIAPRELMACLFEEAGVKQNQAQTLAEAVANAIGPSADAQSSGGGGGSGRRGQPSQATTPPPAESTNQAPARTKLSSVEDLSAIDGIGPDLLADLRPYLTIYSQKAVPNLPGATPLVVHAVKHCQRDKGPSGGFALDADDKSQKAAPIVLRIISEASVDAASFTRVAIVELTEAPQQPPSVLWWGSDVANGDGR